ncbi:hypothetical protein [Actinosynnema sp. NPDC023587]|uniref:hypothetical protein n=1 Tax=Actinosynnema sp. NPDC023587 TaxID=3154695 RepID=UPI00340E3237
MSLKHDAKPVLGKPIPTTPASGKALAVLRLAMGFLFSWAFLDKLFGLGYATPSGGAWIGGGSPAKGFLGHVEVGPFQSPLRGMAGSGWVDLAFMLGLAGLGVAVLLGVVLRISAVAGSVLMALMWIAEWPLAQHTSSGAPSGSTNPLIDYHVVYALVLIVLAVAHAGHVWGLGRRWADLTVVRTHPWLR